MQIDVEKKKKMMPDFLTLFGKEKEIGRKIFDMFSTAMKLSDLCRWPTKIVVLTRILSLSSIHLFASLTNSWGVLFHVVWFMDHSCLLLAFTFFAGKCFEVA